ncbi:MAG: hypothetical protein JOZ47_08860 [Kutzneria sp.]|nr:hypothetical protein [Kutzneria sp.]MBV9845166.1 hypothetical protein [Kutzneria sp.]
MNAYRSHVAGTSLPVPCMIQFMVGSRSIDVQPGGNRNTIGHLVELLHWVHSLHEVRVQWWRPDRSDQLHITALGRSPAGVGFRVYCGIDYPAVAGLVRLTLGEQDSVSVDELHLLVGLLREDAA